MFVLWEAVLLGWCNSLQPTPHTYRSYFVLVALLAQVVRHKTRFKCCVHGRKKVGYKTPCYLVVALLLLLLFFFSFNISQKIHTFRVALLRFVKVDATPLILTVIVTTCLIWNRMYGMIGTLMLGVVFRCRLCLHYNG